VAERLRRTQSSRFSALSGSGQLQESGAQYTMQEEKSEAGKKTGMKRKQNACNASAKKRK
jgi:hypothetical protein